MRAHLTLKADGPLRTYELRTDADLRENPPERQVTITETPGHPVVRTGNMLFDGLYALAGQEARQNSVSEIKDWAYGQNTPLAIEAFQTGEKWTYVWTRDLSYSCYLGLAGFDPARAVTSLLFKSSEVKASVPGGYRHQIIQDTGSGGSYPVSSDRIVWILGADATLQRLPDGAREQFLAQVYALLRDTIEQDRRLIFDPADGLYRGEQSFLDWREQTYPARTKDNVMPIALSKALSVNAAYHFALRKAADYARLLGQPADADRYAHWAQELKAAINRGFYDPAAGLYATYLYSEGGPAVRVHRYDLLGESLAMLLGVASPEQTASILKNYPVGPHGPSVVWPQERSVAIYHNQAIWPFVTAFWLKAARSAGHAEAVDRGIAWFQQEAAENLSNMENFDFVSGRAEVRGQVREGPVVNSKRQLWSVGGYLSMVQDIVFGLETSWDGVRFAPAITAQLRRATFGGSEVLELRDFDYRGAKITVRVHLPAVTAEAKGFCPVLRAELNGRQVGPGFVGRAALTDTNQWDLYLGAPTAAETSAPLRMVDVSNERAIFGPAQPEWDETRGGITVEKGLLALHLRATSEPVVYNIYRDGMLCAPAWHGTDWVDAKSADHAQRVHEYAVEAVDPASGNASHLSPPRTYAADRTEQVIPAAALVVTGGKLVANHLEDWGQPSDTIETAPFTVARTGRHVVRVEFSNGAGPVNTGITCGVKKIELLTADGRKVVASGYAIMPQSGDWQRWDLSSPFAATLAAGERYVVRLSADEVARNMSYLRNNTRYTNWPGGGDSSYNLVRIASLRVADLGAP